MKKIFYILSICVMTILQPSCDALDLAPEDYYGAGNFWKEASQPKACRLTVRNADGKPANMRKSMG